MAIAKVEQFYDAIRKYNSTAGVIKRTELEVKYLNEQCGSIGSLKRYFSVYRNYLKANIQEEETIKGVSLLKLLLQTLRLNDKQQTKFMQAQRQEVSSSQGNLRKIYNVEEYINIAIGLLGAVSVYDRILSVCALTGRRSGEVACSAILNPIEDKKLQAVFEGQLKVKNRSNVTPYKIPLLYDYDSIVKTLSSIRENKPQFINNPALFNATASSKLSTLVKKRFVGLFEGDQKVKDLRAIYALLVFNQYQEKEEEFITVSKNKFFAKVLGHSVDDVVTCGSYIDFCTPVKRR